jgi:hypothetical protein
MKNTDINENPQLRQNAVSGSALIEGILISEYDGRIFKPYNGNRCVNVEFLTYKSCLDFIEKEDLIDFYPEVGWELGLGNYRKDFRELMKVVEKICQEKFDDESNETSYLRTFGMINEDGDFMVRFNRGHLFTDETLIGATLKAVVDYLRNRV